MEEGGGRDRIRVDSTRRAQPNITRLESEPRNMGGLQKLEKARK